jgi:protein TonB
MGYQALLFCPDEKTARTVTQVLSDLDFAVTPCTEPFAAVKKLMGEHFDAVVVDCDNEQNATLLFKSARNAPNNQSSLAVAVVEGQVGVAKAFRIGANLVLTKPINVEQAKGTLRVARGLLRKGEAAKPASAATATTVKSGSSASTPSTFAPPKAITAGAPSWPSSPASPAISVSPVQNSTPRPIAVASAPAAAASAAPVEPQRKTTAAQASAPHVDSAVSMPAIEATEPDKTNKFVTAEQTATRQAEVSTPPPSVASPKSSGGIGSGAASAPAPALETKPGASTEDKLSTVVAKPQTPVEEVPDAGSSEPATTLTFGGTVGSAAKSTESSESRKTLLAVAIVLLIVAGAYLGWAKWHGTISWPGHVAPQPSSTAAVPRLAPSAMPVPKRAPPVPATAAPAVAGSTLPTPSGTSTQTQPAKNSSGTQATGTVTSSPEDVQPRSSKVSAAPDSPKPSASALTDGTAPSTKAAVQHVVAKKSPAMQADAPAPSLAGIASENAGALPNLTSPGSTPTPVLQTMSVSQGVSQGLLLRKVQPGYPSNALRLHIEGPVQLRATISKNGNISAVKILSGDPQLAQAAVEAVKQWKYKPYLLNGQPVEIETQVTINFKLPR